MILDEPTVVAAAQAGDRDALAALVDAYQDRVYRFARRLCGDGDARDITQETLATLARDLGSFRGEARLSSWLFAVARNHCRKARRPRPDAPTAAEPIADEVIADAPGPEAAVADAELKRALDDALAGLEPDHREVVMLRDVEGLTAPETAAVLGLSVDAVKSRLHRARGALREALAARLEAPAPATAACPDIATLWSRRLEGDVAPVDCAAMERHLEACPRCAGACATLRQTLALCQAAPAPVPPEVQAAIREGLRGLRERR